MNPFQNGLKVIDGEGNSGLNHTKHIQSRKLSIELNLSHSHRNKRLCEG